MRFMILLKADKHSEAGAMPDRQLIADMGRYNEELARAGVLLGGEGLHPTANAARVLFSGNRREVVEGPFNPEENLVSGFWILQVKSREEAIDWVKRCPNPLGETAEIEIRRIFEAEDFGEEFTPELRAQEQRLREQLSSRH